MNFFLSVALSATVVATIATTATGSNSNSNSNSGFIPHRIHYDDLLLDDSSRPTTGFSLLDALEESSGLVSVTHLPHDFATIKKEVMSHLHSCLLEQQQQQRQEENDDAVVVVAEESFLDGTIRRTFATATTITDGPLPMKLSSTGDACRLFETNLDQFRAIANLATQRFAKALSRAMEPHLMKPLLTTKNKQGTHHDSTNAYDTIADLVDNGEILEHFHSYQKTNTNKRVGEEYNDDDDDDNDTMTTIDLHTDQGFFIAFTPGMTMQMKSSNIDEITDATSDVASSSSSDGFYIIEEGNYNGIPIHVDFDVETDDLVFMLGDGVNQYINNRVIAASDESDRRRVLRATPHAVSLHYHDDESFARVWYGRMVLPPNDALVAMDDDAASTVVQTTLTYGDIRRRLVETPDAYIPAGLGCSSSTMRALQHGSTHEEESACDQGSLFCWARCMDLAEYELTEEMCEEQNLGLKCINPRGQFSTGEKHGDFYPVCTNTTLEVTPYPEIPQKDASSCTSSDWEQFMTGTDTNMDVIDDTGNAVSYDHTFDLTNEKNDGAAFQWSVVDEEKGMIQGRLVFGNVFGWLALGFAQEGGKHNGMNGGNILMALPGMNYTTQYGLTVPGMTKSGSDEIMNATDISVEIAKRQRSTTIDGTIINPDGSSVAEYQISPEGSSFRHWSEPTTGTTTATENGNTMNVIVSDCFTALTFQTDNINGTYFNVSGTDDLMWAGNSQDYHVGYHGRGHRARFYINWMTGEGSFWTAEDEDDLIVADHGGDSDHHSTDHHDGDDSGGPANNNMMSQPILTSILLAVMLLQLL